MAHRPTWLGYIHVPDVDATVAAIEQAGGKALMPAIDIPNVGRIAMVTDPQGAPFYVMKPIPPAGGSERQERRLLARRRAARRLERALDQRSGRGPPTSTASSSAGAAKSSWIWARWANIASSSMTASDIGALVRSHAAAASSPTGATISACRRYRRAAKAVAEQDGGNDPHGPHQVPSGDWILIGIDPQGAEFALVGGQ